jgi:hypothetical protein
MSRHWQFSAQFHYEFLSFSVDKVFAVEPADKFGMFLILVVDELQAGVFL